MTAEPEPESSAQPEQGAIKPEAALQLLISLSKAVLSKISAQSYGSPSTLEILLPSSIIIIVIVIGECYFSQFLTLTILFASILADVAGLHCEFKIDIPCVLWGRNVQSVGQYRCRLVTDHLPASNSCRPMYPWNVYRMQI